MVGFKTNKQTAAEFSFLFTHLYRSATNRLYLTVTKISCLSFSAEILFSITANSTGQIDFKNCSNSDIQGSKQLLQTEKYMLYIYINTSKCFHIIRVTSCTHCIFHISWTKYLPSKSFRCDLPYSETLTVTVQETETSNFKHTKYPFALLSLSLVLITHHQNQNTKLWGFLSAALNSTN